MTIDRVPASCRFDRSPVLGHRSTPRVTTLAPAHTPAAHDDRG